MSNRLCLVSNRSWFWSRAASLWLSRASPSLLRVLSDKRSDGHQFVVQKNSTERAFNSICGKRIKTVSGCLRFRLLWNLWFYAWRVPCTRIGPKVGLFLYRAYVTGTSNLEICELKWATWSNCGHLFGRIFATLDYLMWRRLLTEWMTLLRLIGVYSILFICGFVVDVLVAGADSYIFAENILVYRLKLLGLMLDTCM